MNTDEPVIHPDPEPAQRDLGKPPISYRPTGSADEDAHEQQRQAAFDADFKWRGVLLHGFTSSRDALFTQQRLAMGAPSLSACLDDMDAFTGDAHRILWLCSHKPEDWAVLRTSPAALQAAIDTWADENVPQREELAARTTALEIYFASRRNQHEAAPVRKAHGDDEGN